MFDYKTCKEVPVKPMPLFTDTKNSIGLYGGIDELAHNAIAVYWNPLESSGKVSSPSFSLRRWPLSG